MIVTIAWFKAASEDGRGEYQYVYKRRKKMKKSILAAAAVLLLSGAAAQAGTVRWNISEENSGVPAAQGAWTLTEEGDKISGTAALQLSNGNPLSYKFEGSQKDGVWTVNLTDRTDGKKGCVWTGHAPTAGGGTQTTGLLGYANCDGGVKIIIRASH
jgi:hypothetical protein